MKADVKIVKIKSPFKPTGEWYMFYCGNCGTTIDMNYKESRRKYCDKCGCLHNYKETE